MKRDVFSAGITLPQLYFFIDTDPFQDFYL